MSREDTELNLRNLAVLGCRMLAIYFFIWALTELTFVPDDWLTLQHHLERGSVETGMNPTDLYLRRHYLMWLGALLLRVVLLLAASTFFFRAGPKALGLMMWPVHRRDGV